MKEVRRVPLEWVIPEGLEIVFANHLVIQDVDGQFVVTFFQATPPIILKGEATKADTVEKVPATAVARLAIPPQQLLSMIEVLQERYKRFVERQAQSGKGEED
jgi:hypothetical protein